MARLYHKTGVLHHETGARYHGTGRRVMEHMAENARAARRRGSIRTGLIKLKACTCGTSCRGMARANIRCCSGTAAAGGDVTVIDLPEAGIKGNSHMMMDRNNGAIADLIQKWLADKGLVD